jgi:hypothetical protein
VESVYPGQPVLLTCTGGTLRATCVFERGFGAKTLLFSFTSPGAAVSNASRKASTLPACLAGQTRPARRHGTQERTSATHWDSGAHTGVGHVSRGEGCEPVLRHLVVHDDVCFLMWPRA